jgi:hypothetical protein
MKNVHVLPVWTKNTEMYTHFYDSTKTEKVGKCIGYDTISGEVAPVVRSTGGQMKNNFSIKNMDSSSSSGVIKQLDDILTTLQC